MRATPAQYPTLPVVTCEVSLLQVYLDKSDNDKSDFRQVGKIIGNGNIYGGVVSVKSECEFRYVRHFPSEMRVNSCKAANALLGHFKARYRHLRCLQRNLNPE